MSIIETSKIDEMFRAIMISVPKGQEERIAGGETSGQNAEIISPAGAIEIGSIALSGLYLSNDPQPAARAAGYAFF